MTEQHALYEPSWVDEWQRGDRVVSAYTGNRGTVAVVIPGRHLLIQWEPTEREPQGFLGRCSNPVDIVREDES